MSLADLVKDVASKRDKEARLKAVYDEAYEAWIKERFEEINALEASKVERLNAEEKLRSAALAAPEAEVKATFGVGIRNTTEFSYDERIAIEWAIRENAAGVLKLNYSKFETAMRGEVTKGTIPGFVKVMTTKKATIARDLSEVLRDVREAEHGRD